MTLACVADGLSWTDAAAVGLMDRYTSGPGSQETGSDRCAVSASEADIEQVITPPHSRGKGATR